MISSRRLENLRATLNAEQAKSQIENQARTLHVVNVFSL
jgi:hypothetical protein